MTLEAYATLAILVGLFGLLIKTKLPPAAIFMGALTLVITLRLAPLEECLRGFANSGMLTIGALFMVAAGMYTTGAIGLEGAVDHTGLAENIAHLLALMGGTNPFIALAAVFVGAVFLSNFIAHAAAVALMFPIALSMASDLGISFMPFAIIIMLGASYSFISPTGYQTNLMIYGPGGYKFTDFF